MLYHASGPTRLCLPCRILFPTHLEARQRGRLEPCRPLAGGSLLFKTFGLLEFSFRLGGLFLFQFSFRLGRLVCLEFPFRLGRFRRLLGGFGREVHFRSGQAVFFRFPFRLATRFFHRLGPFLGLFPL